jgi:hypothetical protein
MEKVYLPGDFSFIKNEIMRKTLQFDYNVVNKVNAWEMLKQNKIDEIKKLELYPGHSAGSAVVNIRDLVVLSRIGWDDYVATKK